MPGQLLMDIDHAAVEQRKRANRRAWTRPEFIASWQRWSSHLQRLLAAATEHMLREARPGPGMHVLDLASGTGEPALSLARAVAPDGQVTATDLSADILVAAHAHAARLGIENVRFEQADAHELPFATASFDLVTCRFGVMYFVDSGRALAEIARVLRPGGRAVLVVWGSPEQAYFRHTEGVLVRHAAIEPDPHGPDPFAFAEPGALSAALARAGFVAVSETALAIDLVWPGDPASLWQFFHDSTTYAGDLARRIPERWRVISDQVIEELNPYYDGATITLDGRIHLASAQIGDPAGRGPHDSHVP